MPALDAIEQAEVKHALASIETRLTEAIMNTVMVDRILRDLAHAPLRQAKVVGTEPGARFERPNLTDNLSDCL